MGFFPPLLFASSTVTIVYECMMESVDLCYSKCFGAKDCGGESEYFVLLHFTVGREEYLLCSFVSYAFCI